MMIQGHGRKKTNGVKGGKRESSSKHKMDKCIKFKFMMHISIAKFYFIVVATYIIISILFVHQHNQPLHRKYVHKL